MANLFKRLKRRHFLYLAGGILLLLCCLVVGRIVSEISGRRATTSIIERLRARNVPVDDQSMDAFYRSQNSTAHSEEWLQLLPEIQTSEFKNRTEQRPSFDQIFSTYKFNLDERWEYEEEVRKFLKDKQALLNRICELASHREPVDLRIHFQSIKTNFDQSMNLHKLAQFVYVSGLIAMKDRNAQEVVRLLACLDGLAIAISKGSTLGASHTFVAISQFARNILRSALENNIVDPTSLGSMEESLRRSISIEDRWETAIKGEFGLFTPVFLDLLLFGPQGTITRHLDSWEYPFYSSYLERLLDVDVADHATFYRDVNDILFEFDRATRSKRLFSNQPKRWFSIASMGPFTLCCGALIDDCTESRLALLAIAIRMFEKSHGNLPDDIQRVEAGRELSDLVKEIPIGYRVEKGEVLVWARRASTIERTPSEPPRMDGESSNHDKDFFVWRLKRENPVP